MDSKETNLVTNKSNILLYDDEYFRYIFKKTEKIAAAVFYTTRALDSISQKDTVITDIEANTRNLLEVAHKTLETTRGSRHTRLEDLRIALISLQSRLTIGAAARCLPEDLVEVFRHEMSSVHRSLREYLLQDTHNPLKEELGVSEGTKSIKKISSRKLENDISVRANTPNSNGATKGRRERIVSIIKDKGDATIKDISASVTDCSEKTIQRELMSLIAEGVLQKNGERRWSRYTLA